MRPQHLFLYCNLQQCQLASLGFPLHPSSAELGGRLSVKRIDIVVGTRPEAIKLAPVAAALTERGLGVRLILTGQHPLDAAEHGLAAYDRITLNCPGHGEPHRHVEAISREISPHLANRPALLVVQGDTASACGGALAAFAAAVPVAHVEAGLRSFDPRSPWPEEEFRTAIDARAALLFAPTDLSAANLEAEGVPGRIFITGNTGIDALLAVADQSGRARLNDGGPVRLLVTCHRRESWGAGLRSIGEALIELVAAHPVTAELVLHPNPAVAGAMRELLTGRTGITLVEPLSHADMVAAIQRCDILLSDSGGMQEEAPALGVPLLVLREKTERPEGVASGNMILVGTDKSRIVQGVVRLLDPAVRAAMSRRAFPYGDGRAASRIAAHIAGFLSVHEMETAQERRA